MVRAEAAVILGEVVDRRRRRRRRRTIGRLRSAVEIGTAFDLEAEIDLGELRIESRQHCGNVERILRRLSSVVHQAQTYKAEKSPAS